MKRSFPAAAPDAVRRLRFFAAPVLVFLISASQLGGCCPFALALVASVGAGARGLLCLVGAAGGAWLFLDFQPGLRYVASAVLICAACTAFSDTRCGRHRFFPPVAAGISSLLVQSVYLIGRPWRHLILLLFALGVQTVACLLFTALSAADAPSQRRRQLRWLLLGALALAVLPLYSSGGFSASRALMSAAVLLCATT